MKCQRILFCLILVTTMHANDAARILGIFPYNGRSHFQMFEVLCKGLAKAGHQVDVVSHFPLKKPIPNYTDIIDLRGSMGNVVNNITVEDGRVIHQSIIYYIATKFGTDLCHQMGLESMQKLIKNPPNDPPYDLVIMEYFASPCFLGFGELLKVPVVVAVSFLPMSYVDDFMGNPPSYSFFSGFSTDNPVVSTFFDRMWNFLLNYRELILYYHYTTEQTEIMRKYLGLPNLPDIRELERKISLALVNSHHTYYGIRPNTPAVVDVGGLHVENDHPKLSPELQSKLDAANHGLVYFTLGSLFNIETLPREKVLSIYASFAKIAPIKVLMKSANATKLPPGLPSNVITSPWIPQVAVLRHKNTRLFITHGGLMGTQEALYYGIPMIGIPVFADQIKNVNTLVHLNMALLLSIDDITEHTLDVALNALLHDPKYREAAKKHSKAFRDRPFNMTDTAVYWVEYVLRNGPDCLRSPVVNLTWWQSNLIDVFIFLAACIILAICSLVVLVKIVLRNLYKADVQVEKKLN